MSKTHVDYDAAVSKQLDRIGHVNGSKLPDVNDPVTAAAQEYAIAQLVKRHAEKRYDVAKITLARLCPGTDAVAHSSAFVDVSRTTRDGAMLLDQASLLNGLVTRFKLTVDQARDFVQSHKKQGAASVSFNATLKE